MKRLQDSEEVTSGAFHQLAGDLLECCPAFPCRIFVKALGRDPLGDLHYLVIKELWLLDAELEQFRPGLEAKVEVVAPAFGDKKSMACTLAFEQCVCRHCCPHANGVNVLLRNRLATGELLSSKGLQYSADSLRWSVRIVLGVHGKQLQDGIRPSRNRCPDICEGTTTV